MLGVLEIMLLVLFGLVSTILVLVILLLIKKLRRKD